MPSPTRARPNTAPTATRTGGANQPRAAARARSRPTPSRVTPAPVQASSRAPESDASQTRRDRRGAGGSIGADGKGAAEKGPEGSGACTGGPGGKGGGADGCGPRAVGNGGPAVGPGIGPPCHVDNSSARASSRRPSRPSSVAIAATRSGRGAFMEHTLADGYWSVTPAGTTVPSRRDHDRDQVRFRYSVTASGPKTATTTALASSAAAVGAATAPPVSSPRAASATLETGFTSTNACNQPGNVAVGGETGGAEGGGRVGGGRSGGTGGGGGGAGAGGVGGGGGGEGGAGS